MLLTQCYGIQVSRDTRHKQTNKQTNKPTDYYTRGRPRAPRVTTKQLGQMTTNARKVNGRGLQKSYMYLAKRDTLNLAYTILYCLSFGSNGTAHTTAIELPYQCKTKQQLPFIDCCLVSI